MVNKLFRFIGEALDPKPLNKSSGETPADRQKKPETSVVGSTSRQSQVKQMPPKRGTVIDSKTGEVVEEAPSEMREVSRTLSTVERQLPPNLSQDIIRLAAQNKAFFQGILALQKLHLDEDLFHKAIEDLKKKYYEERNSIIH